MIVYIIIISISGDKPSFRISEDGASFFSAFIHSQPSSWRSHFFTCKFFCETMCVCVCVLKCLAICAQHGGACRCHATIELPTLRYHIPQAQAVEGLAVAIRSSKTPCMADLLERLQVSHCFRIYSKSVLKRSVYWYYAVGQIVGCWSSLWWLTMQQVHDELHNWYFTAKKISYYEAAVAGMFFPCTMTHQHYFLDCGCQVPQPTYIQGSKYYFRGECRKLWLPSVEANLKLPRNFIKYHGRTASDFFHGSGGNVMVTEGTKLPWK